MNDTTNNNETPMTLDQRKQAIEQKLQEYLRDKPEGGECYTIIRELTMRNVLSHVAVSLVLGEDLYKEFFSVLNEEITTLTNSVFEAKQNAESLAKAPETVQ